MKNNMRNKNLLYALLIGCALNSCGSNPATGDETSLKEAVGNKFHIGVAGNTTKTQLQEQLDKLVEGITER